ncbi:3-oxoacyl-[acyl-carrier-protein] reductase [Clostridium chauvoei]|uniref:3-oxoacyl-[acyl-carrier-protein] reductase n=2 Tax=Clostridium chauvoei TaxID=46867 RepID=S6EYY2_9CLOT|nr:3-oxoacyl-[acyl-carrier-protein] reductase [Clostridium chauvoei]ATD54860.1 beta-ketoacyl-ACP reductase [Clostridium chauvoei]ATD57461.1 3-oxoacyl-[acyl-carrier-protein] reductase [Clostridium chauvoei]MBX7280528.1 3-oxoacyl-[acyl-carrier-protein] reductase [Clostridium chauvoei]MBX7283013.1 3-oxoacyl-[acyl-carrier-protein] reductase [Clostridium chauvoei]MBX7285530.1 3-oxoacyl-[acyl-carrier-protein] reductase [Clostridium chauvoei]
MLKNKCAVVTGATRGIGRAIAKKYAKLGANIVINYRNSDEEAKKLEEELRELGVEVLVVKADISDFEEAQNLINLAKETFGTVDILVNNAGITKDGLVMRMKEEDFDSVIEVNLKGVFNCLRAVSPIMIRQKSGKIINMSSVVGIIGNAGQINYCAAKAGVIGMTKSLAREIGGRGINVNAIAPGFIQTDMTNKLSDKNKEMILGNIPLKRLGNVEDIAEVAAFLASDASSYITGQVISVDGGMAI